MINTFLLNDMVISHTLGLRSLIIMDKTEGYQALYNILVKHHPNLTTKHKVHTIYPVQEENKSFISHVKQVQQYLSAERSRCRDYTDQEVLALTISTLHNKFWMGIFEKNREVSKKYCSAIQTTI